MTIIDILTEESRKIGASEEAIKKAHSFASGLAGQGKDAKKALYKELSDEEIKFYTEYIQGAMMLCALDPDIMKKAGDMVNEQRQKN